MLDLLDASALGLQSSRARLLSIQTDVGLDETLSAWRSPGPEFLRAIRLLIETAAELFEEVQAFKTEVLEHDADRAARVEGMTAASPEELKKLFARL